MKLPGLFFYLLDFAPIYAWKDDDDYICFGLVLPGEISYFNRAFFQNLKVNQIMERRFWLLKTEFSHAMPLNVQQPARIGKNIG
jgi:hypothetical protein